MPRVAVLFTGGTISMGFDPVAGGNVPALDGAAILARTPGLDEIAEIVAIDRGRTPASHFSFADLIAILAVVRLALEDPSIDGGVVVQGTDTIEETAFAWDLLHADPRPIVVTGAMRAPHEDGYDGAATSATPSPSRPRRRARPRGGRHARRRDRRGRRRPEDPYQRVHDVREPQPRTAGHLAGRSCSRPAVRAGTWPPTRPRPGAPRDGRDRHGRALLAAALAAGADGIVGAATVREHVAGTAVGGT
jgi:hypothetical protein